MNDIYTTKTVMERTGLSRSRCIQFAREKGIHVQDFGGVRVRVWTEEDIQELEERKGKRGYKLFT